MKSSKIELNKKNYGEYIEKNKLDAKLLDIQGLEILYFIYSETPSVSTCIAFDADKNLYYSFVLGKSVIINLGDFEVVEKAEKYSIKYILKNVSEFGKKKVNYSINGIKKSFQINWKEDVINTVPRFGIEEFARFIFKEDEDKFPVPENDYKFSECVLEILNIFRFELYIHAKGIIFSNPSIFFSDFYFVNIDLFRDFLMFIIKDIAKEIVKKDKNPSAMFVFVINFINTYSKTARQKDVK